MDCSSSLPSEVIFEILSRTSLETLEQCKAASNLCKQMIYEATFLPLYCKRANCVFGYFFQNFKKHHKYSSALVSDAAAAATIKESWPCAGMTILASSDDGILCCQRHIWKGDYRYYACKPATKQWQALPNPKLRYRTAAVALVVVERHPLRYLIVRLSDSGAQYNCEIFDSKIWAWEKVECTIPFSDRIYAGLAGVTIGQSMYWLTTTNDNVLTLDVTKRCFRCFPLPEMVRCNNAYECKQLVDYEGELGLRCMVGDRIELWVAERRRRGEWRKKVAVDMTNVEKTLSCQQPEPVEFCNTDVAFIKTDNGAVFYNRQNHNFSKVEVPYDLRNPKHIFRFRSDFESVELKGGR